VRRAAAPPAADQDLQLTVLRGNEPHKINVAAH
jgi:hypothetical protein